MKSTTREVVSFFVFLCQVNFFANAVEVVTPVGKIIGSDHLRTKHGKVIYSFTGIPYAQPPVGDLRFKEPLAVKPWSEPFNATKEGSFCPQIRIFQCFDECFKPFGDEDCLSLDVYTPKVDRSAKLPVMVFIHGGAYTIKADGSSPEFLLDRDVILMSLQFRLGALGYMTTGDESVPTNLGLKDQVLALKWVRDNIEHFGGDPKRITVFGHSSGGSSVHFHLTSPLSQDLIHGGISMSGTLASTWAAMSMQLAKARTKAFAVLCGCPAEPSEKLLKCMQKIPVEVLIEMQGKFQNSIRVPKVVFAPVVETDTFSETGKLDSNIPWMAGSTSGDGLFFASNLLDAMESNKIDMKRQSDYILPRALQLDNKFVEDEVPSIFKKIKEFYLGNKPVEKENIQKVVDMFTDVWYLSGTVESASEYRGNAYLYYYDFLSSVSLSTVIGNGNIKGVCHGDDTLNLFPSSNTFPNRSWSETEIAVSETMLDLWTNFAKYGYPTANTSVKWEPTKKETETNKYLHISRDGNFTQKENLLSDRMEFWRSLTHQPLPA